MADEMYAIVHRDNKGLFTWYREKYETAPNTEVVMIYKGNIKEIEKKAKEFEKENKNKSLKQLSNKEISDLIN